MSHRCYAGGVKTLDGSTPINPTAWCSCGWEREFTDWNEAATACKNHRGQPENSDQQGQS